ncbi:hypothetical protein A9Q96_02540 [Rhodobacterales bacterium 52_120_T64]|nr:hypothetical protein A9Q96_02540 [Rhodobacterales bacterium 52_120_T64]
MKTSTIAPFFIKWKVWSTGVSTHFVLSVPKIVDVTFAAVRIDSWFQCLDVGASFYEKRPVVEHMGQDQDVRI